MNAKMLSLKNFNFKNRCIWQSTNNPRAPRCIYPKTMGYEIEGQVTSDSQLHKFSIRQKLKKTIFNTDIHQLVDVRVEMYSQKSLRIKVCSLTISDCMMLLTLFYVYTNFFKNCDIINYKIFNLT